MALSREEAKRIRNMDCPSWLNKHGLRFYAFRCEWCKALFTFNADSYFMKAYAMGKLPEMFCGCGGRMKETQEG